MSSSTSSLNYLASRLSEKLGVTPAKTWAAYHAQVDTIKKPVTEPPKDDLSVLLKQQLNRVEGGVEKILELQSKSVTQPVFGLPPMKYDHVLWDWKRGFHASEWGNNYSTIPWKSDRVSRRGDDIVLKLDGKGAPEIQAMTASGANKTKGLWEVETTLSKPKAGVIQAPLWLYDNDSGDEIDFEIVGDKGLQVALHVKRAKHFHQVITEASNIFERRVRLAISMDLEAGVIEMLVDGKMVHRWDRQSLGVFPDKPLKPWFSMWSTNPADVNLSNWSGKFEGLKEGSSMEMVIHGYRYSER